MEKLFYKKWTSVMAIVAVLVIVLLLCMLLTFLAQQSAFEQRIQKIEAYKQQAEKDVETQKTIIEYKKTDEYVIEWAISQGLVNRDDYLLVSTD